ncbi:PAS domain-containing protein [Arcanobacterium phocisimile]|uniref:PAS domain-containing protein n=1 Tax=Arcanobacterium phocisimile TaxID=1302235 RepID=A0ABX7IG59_9ACTO|nr:PAS domain-containing protein [Arcanobacterium phocisimile]QRV01840.1 PAS domain-containing protein [Arcanobacterium phocisimile]
MVEPTGSIHDVPVDELFFSTTDAKGIIDLSNSVFTRMSRYPREKLHAAPHNIIRHPDMPAAAFKVMWDTLQAGEPFAAYVRNLAADGSEYRVFATITPLHDGGYLSVRSRPLDEARYGAVAGIYEVVRQAERELLSQGANRRLVAEQGVGVLVQTLADAGIDSYEGFQNDALVSEVHLREQLSSGFPVRSGEGELVGVLERANEVCELLNSWMSKQKFLADIAQKISETLVQAGSDMTYMSSAGEKFVEFGAQRPQLASLTMPLTVWAQMQPIVSGYMSSLAERLAQLQMNVSRTQFRIALSRLHIYMYGLFVAEILDESHEDNRERIRALTMLGEALIDDIHTLDVQAQRTISYMGEVGGYMSQVVQALAIPRQLLGMWGTGADLGEQGEEVVDIVSMVRAAKNRADESLQTLADLADRLSSVTELNANSDLIQGHLRSVCEVVNALG